MGDPAGADAGARARLGVIAAGPSHRISSRLLLLRLAFRAAQLVPTLLVASLLAFALAGTMGDPAATLLGQDDTAQARAEAAHEMGLDRPWPERYVGFVGRALRGDLGTSMMQAEPVARLLLRRLPASLELVVAAFGLSLLVGVPLGVLAAVRPRAPASRLAMGLSLLGAAIPTFLLGLLLQFVLATWLGWLPAFGRGQVVSLPGGWTTGLLTASGRASLVLPATTLGLFEASLVTRLVRAEVASILPRGFVTFARARGLPPRLVLRRHVLRHAAPLLLTVLAPQFGVMLAFAVVTESVFQWPGLGLLLLQSLASADLAVVAAYVLLAAVLFSAINLLVDVAVGLLAAPPPAARTW